MSGVGTSATIHPTATVAPGAELGEGVTIGAYCRIGPDVKIGANTFILMQDVPGNTTVAGTPGRIVKMNGQEVSMKLPRSKEGQTEAV